MSRVTDEGKPADIRGRTTNRDEDRPQVEKKSRSLDRLAATVSDSYDRALLYHLPGTPPRPKKQKRGEPVPNLYLYQGPIGNAWQSQAIPKFIPKVEPVVEPTRLEFNPREVTQPRVVAPESEPPIEPPAVQLPADEPIEVDPVGIEQPAPPAQARQGMNPDQFEKWTKQSNEAEWLRIQSQAVAKCDGSLVEAVRYWLSDIELSDGRLGNAGKIRTARMTATGPLRKELERVLQRKVNASTTEGYDSEQVPWEEVRTELSNVFLTSDEAETMRAKLEKIRQGTNETVHRYNSRFQDMADIAYPKPDGGAPRSAEASNLLIKWYIRGLKSDAYARKLTEHTPVYKNIEEVVAAAVNLVQSKERYGRVGRGETPMEVDAIDWATDPGDAALAETAKLRREVSRLTNTLAEKKGRDKLLAQTVQALGVDATKKGKYQKPQKKKGGGGPKKKNDKGSKPPPKGPDTRKCFHCQRKGHIARHCPIREAEREVAALNINADDDWS